MRAMLFLAGLLAAAALAQAARGGEPLAVQRDSQAVTPRQQVAQAVYRDITTLLRAMERASAAKQAVNEAGSAINDALAAHSPDRQVRVPAYPTDAPSDPCVGDKVDDWRRCIDQIDQNLGQIETSSERRSVTQQLAALRRRLTTVSDSELSVADLRGWTVQLRRAARTLEPTRTLRPTQRLAPIRQRASIARKAHLRGAQD